MGKGSVQVGRASLLPCVKANEVIKDAKFLILSQHFGRR